MNKLCFSLFLSPTRSLALPPLGGDGDATASRFPEGGQIKRAHCNCASIVCVLPSAEAALGAGSCPFARANYY